MKKILMSVAVGFVLVSIAFAGEDFFRFVKAQYLAVAENMAVGTTSINHSYNLDVVGASRFTGAVSQTGAQAVVGSVAVSTASDSSVRMALKGAVVSLSTRNVTMGDLYYQTSDNKVYVATRTWGENVATCPTTLCYVALN